MAPSERHLRIRRAIEARREALLEDLIRLVAIPTGGFHAPGLDETRAILRDRLVALGASYHEVPGDPKPAWLLGKDPAGSIPPTGICRRTDGRPGPRILIAGHLDTVHDPAGPFRELTIREDGTATGPGCVDMKGGLVIALHALEALEELGEQVAWTYLFNSDEETGTYHSERALVAEAREHDLGIALEPALADGSLAIERMGSGQFMIEAVGRSAHVGREFEKGVSAVTALAEAIVAVSKMPDPKAGRILSIGPLQGGAATNAVPDLARAWGNARFPNEQASQEIGRMLDDLATPADAMPRITIHRSFNRPAKPKTPQVEAFATAARRAAEDLGQKLPFASTGGVCDGNVLQAAGLATIDTLGVRGGGLHTPDEWIELDSLVERCCLLAVLLSRLASGEEAV